MAKPPKCFGKRKAPPARIRLNIHVPLSVRMALNCIAQDEGETLQAVALRILKAGLAERSTLESAVRP